MMKNKIIKVNKIKYGITAAALLGLISLSGCSKDGEDTLFEPIGNENESQVIETEQEEQNKSVIEADGVGDIETEDTVDTDAVIDEETDSAISTQTNESGTEEKDSSAESDAVGNRSSEEAGILTSAEDINLQDVDGQGTNYSFTYNSENYSAVYRTDNWTIYNSYKINSMSDMTIICQALIDIHPIHGRDMSSYRSADDMVYEWMQHNIAYAALPVDSELKSHARDVDFNPEDQGRSFEELYKDRTGKDLDINDILTEEQQDKLIESLKEMLESGN